MTKHAVLAFERWELLVKAFDEQVYVKTSIVIFWGDNLSIQFLLQGTDMDQEFCDDLGSSARYLTNHVSMWGLYNQNMDLHALRCGPSTVVLMQYHPPRFGSSQGVLP